jgi:hypothetical protein
LLVATKQQVKAKPSKLAKLSTKGNQNLLLDLANMLQSRWL